LTTWSTGSVFLLRASCAAVPSAVAGISPNLKAYAETFVRFIRHECVRNISQLGERHLRTVIGKFVEHFHGERNHQRLSNVIPSPPCRRPHLPDENSLGGLLNFYERAAA